MGLLIENIFEKPNNIFTHNRGVGLNIGGGISIEQADTRRDFYRPRGTDGLDIRGALWAGWSFTIGARASNKSVRLTNITLWLIRTGNPGDITCSVREVDGNSLPTGADIDSKTLTQAQANVPTASRVPVSFDFLGERILRRSKQYAIVLRATAGDGSNKYQSSGNSTEEVPGEVLSSSTNSGSSWSVEASDQMNTSEVYGIVWD